MLLCAVALIYALLAGLHTLQDFDLGWQLATGRWVLQHHQVFSTDVFSYTARGAEWVYPPLSGVIFYLVYLAGGYALLSWLGALVCASTVALLLRRDLASIALALISVPLIANRTQPRAEMFTTILFAAFLALLWDHYYSRSDGKRHLLWLLPILMVLWVNLHPGFVSGIALCCAYVLFEALDLLFGKNPHAVVERLKSAWPWLVLTVAATIVNPWGLWIYRALLKQEQQQQVHNLWVVEWENLRPSLASAHQAFAWRDPQSAFWWLLGIAGVCMVVALLRGKIGEAILLGASIYLAMQHVRYQALFACVIVVIGGRILRQSWKRRSTDGTASLPLQSLNNGRQRSEYFSKQAVAAMAAIVLLTILAGVRAYDLVGDRYYLKSNQLSLFGTGLSWWFPDRAIDFILREKLPANIFNTYTLGGYLTWRMFPQYSDYIDSRAIPFGPELFFRAYGLSTTPPDASAWQHEAETRGINTIIVPVGRYSGITLFPQLPAFCQSQTWRPAYLDEVSAVFVRRTVLTSALIDRLQIDCDKVAFAPLNATRTNLSLRARAELFNSWTNAAGVLYALGRYPEALAYLDHAQTIFSDNANLHLTRALVLEHTGRTAEAEQEFRTSLSLHPGDEAWFDLGLFYVTQKRYADAAQVFRRSAEASARPHDMWMMLGQAELQMNQPRQALEAFDKAEAASPFRGEAQSLGASFNSLIATGRAKAWYQLGDLDKAVSYQEQAVQFAPNDAKLWLGLADLYEAQGRTTKAAEARGHAAGGRP